MMCVRKTKGIWSQNIPLEVTGIAEPGSESEPSTLCDTSVPGEALPAEFTAAPYTGTTFLSHVMQMNPLLNAMGVPVILLIKTKT